MNKRHLITILYLLLCMGIALGIRIIYPYDKVFTDIGIKFTDPDAYYHLYLMDIALHNSLDAGTFYPFFTGEGGYTTHTLFNLVLSGSAWLFGGADSAVVADTVAVYFPAVLGALVVIPVYFIGRALWNRLAGFAAAILIAVMPGEFMGRSILGSTDHHVAEALLTATMMLFMILALKEARAGITRKMIVYSILAGAWLGVYLLSWVGGALFVFIITVYIVVQSIIDVIKGRRIYYLCFIGAVVFGIALIMALSQRSYDVEYLTLIIALCVPAILVLLIRLTDALRLQWRGYIVAVAMAAGIGCVILRLANPELFSRMLSDLNIFAPAILENTIVSEMQPLTPWLAWGNFVVSSVFAAGGIALISYQALKRDCPGKVLFIAWSVVIFILTAAQVRFAYYLAVNVAVLAGFMLAVSYNAICLGMDYLRNSNVVDFRKKALDSLILRASSRWAMIIWAALIIFVLMIPSTRYAVATASQASYTQTDAWISTLNWMRANTPEPLGDDSAYYQSYDEQFVYPKTAYSVFAWRDYEFAITRVAHRIPYDRYVDARYYVLSDGAINDDYALAVIDYTMVADKFYAIVMYAEEALDTFAETYYIARAGELIPVTVFYPAYYETRLVRLYCFDGQAVDEVEASVITYENRVGDDGAVYKVITEVKQFGSYAEAESYRAGKRSPNCVVGSFSQLANPVPIKAIANARLIHGSEERVEGVVPEVKVFELVGKNEG